MKVPDDLENFPYNAVFSFMVRSGIDGSQVIGKIEQNSQGRLLAVDVLDRCDDSKEYCDAA